MVHTHISSLSSPFECVSSMESVLCMVYGRREGDRYRDRIEQPCQWMEPYAYHGRGNSIVIREREATKELKNWEHCTAVYGQFLSNAIVVVVGAAATTATTTVAAIAIAIHSCTGNVFHPKEFKKN